MLIWDTEWEWEQRYGLLQPQCVGGIWAVEFTGDNGSWWDMKYDRIIDRLERLHTYTHTHTIHTHTPKYLLIHTRTYLHIHTPK